MSKFICLVLCAVVVSLNNVYAGEEEKAAFRDAIKPFIEACKKEHDVSDADLMKAKEAKSADSLKPCFMGCVFKKFEIINDKGEYDADTGIAKLKAFVKNDDRIAKLVEIGKKCESVNSEAVSDGEAGCERAVLLSKCFMEHKSEIPI